MKVIFIEDVPDVARAGDAREVADGYARNYLLPRKLAVLANSQASGVLEAQLKKIAKRQAETEAEMAELATKLNGMEITVKAKAGAKDRLYGSVTSADITDELARSKELVVDKRKIEIAEPIHTLGAYDVTVRFTHDITAVIKVTVVGEQGEEAKEEVKAEEPVEKEEEPAVKKEKKAKKTAEKKEDTGEKKAAPKAEKKEKKVKAEKKEGGEEEKKPKAVRKKKEKTEETG